MERKYMVVGYGLGKESHEPYSRAYRIKEGEPRDGSKVGYGYLDQKDTYYTSDIRPLGTVITLSFQEV